MIVDRICDYDEGYDRADAYEIGWCLRCRANPKCPYRKKAVHEHQKFLEGQSTMKNVTFELPDDVICVSITSLSGDGSGMCFETRNYGEEKLIEGVIVPWKKDKANEF